MRGLGPRLKDWWVSLFDGGGESGRRAARVRNVVLTEALYPSHSQDECGGRVDGVEYSCGIGEACGGRWTGRRRRRGGKETSSRLLLSEG